MGSGSTLVDLVNNVGVNVALIVFFVWQGKRFLEDATRRNDELSARLHDFEKEARETLVCMAKESSTALINNTEVTRDNTRVIAALVKALKGKPCMYAEKLPDEPVTSALERAEK